MLLARCSREFVAPDHRPLTDERRAQILKATDALADEALRTLGVVYRTLPKDAHENGSADPDERVEHDLVFAGLMGMIDPPRKGQACSGPRQKALGIRPLMITGDHPRTAAVIARTRHRIRTAGS